MRHVSALLLLCLMATMPLRWGGVVSPADPGPVRDLRSSSLGRACIAPCAIRLVSPSDLQALPLHGGDKG
jgi:hypothetical protein